MFQNSKATLLFGFKVLMQNKSNFVSFFKQKENKIVWRNIYRQKPYAKVKEFPELGQVTTVVSLSDLSLVWFSHNLSWFSFAGLYDSGRIAAGRIVAAARFWPGGGTSGREVSLVAAVAVKQRSLAGGCGRSARFEEESEGNPWVWNWPWGAVTHCWE